MRSSLKLSLALCLFGGVGLLANENANLDTIEVNASSIGYADVDSLKISNKNAGAIRDVMRDIPGVYVAGTNQFNQKLYMRGVNDRGINITVDGARQRGNIFHHSADLVLDVDLLKAIDVGVGVLSVANNSGALGGSVAFKTASAFDLLEGDESFGGKFKTGYSTNNKEWQKSIMAYGKTDNNFGLLAYINHKNYGFGKDGNGNDIGGKGHDLSYLFKVNYEKDEHKAGLSYEHTEYDGDFPFRGEFGGSVAVDTGTLKAGERAQAILPQTMKRDTYTFNYNFNPNELIDSEFRVYYTEHRLIKDEVPNYAEFKKSGGKAYLSNDGVKTVGAYLNNKTKIEGSSLNQELYYGLEWYQTTSFRKNHANMKDATNGAITVTPTKNHPKEVANNLSVFLQDTIQIGGFSIIPGVRFDRFTIDNFGKKTQGFNNFSPALALDYKAENGINLFAGYSKVFRGPDPIEALRLSENTFNTNYIDENLEPETGDAYEAGFGYKKAFDEHKVNFVAKYFYTDYKNLIKENVSVTTMQNGQAVKNNYNRMNMGKSNVRGVELFASYAYENLKFSASYTHQKTKHDDESKKGAVMAYSDSGDKYTFNAEYFASPIDTLFGYNLIAFTGKTLEDGTKKAGYGVSEIYASYMPTQNLEINLSVSNLFDKTYVSHSQRRFGVETANDYEAGRNIKLGFSYKF